jgi:lipoprotein-releasing system permease protein
MNRPLFSAFKVEKLLMFFAIGLIVVVASFNIITTLVLMVMEKHRDIGILKAMGARPQSISRIFTSQGFSVGALGTALGVALGVGLCYVLHAYKLIPLSPEVYFIPYVPFHVKALDVAVVALAALGISLLATVYPAHQAARLEVIEALKHE